VRPPLGRWLQDRVVERKPAREARLRRGAILLGVPPQTAGNRLRLALTGTRLARTDQSRNRRGSSAEASVCRAKAASNRRASQPERVEDQARDDHCDHTRHDRDHASQGHFVDRPLVDRLCPLLERIGSTEKAVLPFECLERLLGADRLVRLALELSRDRDLGRLHIRHLTVETPQGEKERCESASEHEYADCDTDDVAEASQQEGNQPRQEHP
jgi:hypothetical protein